jgi:hypothetical protein
MPRLFAISSNLLRVRLRFRQGLRCPNLGIVLLVAVMPKRPGKPNGHEKEGETRSVGPIYHLPRVGPGFTRNQQIGGTQRKDQPDGGFGQYLFLGLAFGWAASPGLLCGPRTGAEVEGPQPR